VTFARTASANGQRYSYLSQYLVSMQARETYLMIYSIIYLAVNCIAIFLLLVAN